MTRDVLISISGLQYESPEADTNESIELVCRGVYDITDSIPTVVYDDITEDTEVGSIVTNCTLSFSPEKIVLDKKGDVTVQMIFEEGKNHMSYYSTAYGDFCIGISTNQIDIKETAEQIDILLRYDLEFNYQHISECTLAIKISATSC